MKSADAMPLWKLDLCSVQGHLFELARRKRYDMAAFVPQFMNSTIAAQLDRPYNRYQWSGEEYMLESLEADAPTERLKRMDSISPNALFWMGYTYRYWHFVTGETSRKIHVTADYGRMCRTYAGYHTLGSEEAIERLKKR